MQNQTNNTKHNKQASKLFTTTYYDAWSVAPDSAVSGCATGAPGGGGVVALPPPGPFLARELEDLERR